MSKYREIYQLIVNDIQTGTLKSGDKLSSVRQMSINFGVSKNTIIAAYNLLIEEHWIIAKSKSGYFVAEKKYDEHYRNVSTQFINAYNGVELLGEQLTHSYIHKPGDGRYAREYMNSLKINKYFPTMSHQEVHAFLDYGNPTGNLQLRENIIKILSNKNLIINNDNILLTNGTNNSLDLIIRHFLSKGDTVLVEAPGYYPLFSKLDLAGIRKIGILRDEEGYDLNKLEDLIKKRRPKIFFLQPFAQNPTGTDLSLQTLSGVYELCKKYNILTVEDDPFLLTRSGFASYFCNKDAPSIYVSSFSKTLTASFRCGFIVSSKIIVKSLTKLKLITMVNTSSIVESIINSIINEGDLDNHISGLKKVFNEKGSDMLLRLSNIEGINIFPHNQGGLYAWCKVPVNDKVLTNIAKNKDIFLAPGSLFFPSDIPYYALRFNKFYTDETSVNFLINQIAK